MFSCDAAEGAHKEKSNACGEFPRGRQATQVAAESRNGSFGAAAEAFRIEQPALVVIPEHREIEFHCAINTVPRIRPIPDDVAQAVNRLDLLAGDVGKDGI